MAESHQEAHFQPNIALHRELCLEYARKQRNVFYPSATMLALDYGRNGTTRFFPLSQLTHEITKDDRFKGHIRSKENV